MTKAKREPLRNAAGPLPVTAPSGTYLRPRVRRVLTHGHPALSSPAAPIDPCDPAVAGLANELIATMRAWPACIGLSAPQIGEPVHLFCMDVTGHRKARSCAGLIVLANAHVVELSGEMVMREGCISVPQLTGNVVRAEQITVVGHEVGTARLVRLTANAIEARCLQHEIDHLEGFLFVDRVRDPANDLFARKT